MKKRIFVLVLILCLMLTGCQLAKPEAVQEDSQDRLVGVLVTREPLYLFDMEAYLEDHMDEVLSGQDVVASGAEYEGRIYAQHTMGQGERIYEDQSYEFPGLEGMMMADFWFDYPGNGEDEGYRGNVATEGFGDTATHIINTEEDGRWVDRIKMTGTIYVSARAEICFSFNPIYQTPEGQVYVVEGSRSSSPGDDGMCMTHTLSDEWTTTDSEGKETVCSGEFAVTVQCITPPDTVTVLQMDADHKVLKTETFLPGQLPEDLTPEEGCAYLLTEEIAADGSVSRTLYEPGEETITVFYPREDGICIPDMTRIHWS